MRPAKKSSHEKEITPYRSVLFFIVGHSYPAQTTLLSQNFESGMAGWTTVANTDDSTWEIKTNPFQEPTLGSLTFHSATPTHFAIMISDGDTGRKYRPVISGY